jgi:tetratricopeptide (TPR) repeat protein
MEFGQVSEEHIKIAELSRKIGEILVERGDYEQAMHQFQLGLQYLEGMEHKELVRIYNEIGRVHWAQGNLEEHQTWTAKAFDLAERLLDPDELSLLLLHAGIRYRQQGLNKLAEQHWLRSLEISQETGDLVMQARLYQNLGWQSQTMGNYQLALERLEKGKALAEQCDDTQSLSWIHETLGETYYAQGEWDLAIESFQQSLRLAEQAGLRRATSRVYSFLGDIYRYQGRWTEADECYQNALSAITATGTPGSLFAVYLSLGLINMERQRYDKAREHFERCWAITSRGAGFASRMARVQDAMAELAIQTGDLAEADQHIEQAIQLATEADAHRELAHATMIKALLATKKNQWDQALKHYDYAEQVFEELGDKHDLGRVYAGLGEMYLSRNQNPQDHQRAQEYVSKARAIFTELRAQNSLEKLPKI